MGRSPASQTRDLIVVITQTGGMCAPHSPAGIMQRLVLGRSDPA
jgi:hypothetical protein